MPQMNINVGGSWHKVKQPYVNVGGSWKKVKKGWSNVNGSWKLVFNAKVSHIISSHSRNLNIDSIIASADSDEVDIIINRGVDVYSDDPNIPALTCTNNHGKTVNLIVNGRIVGGGGRSTGEHGGTALRTTVSLGVVNNGNILGGGGAGGAGGAGGQGTYTTTANNVREPATGYYEGAQGGCWDWRSYYYGGHDHDHETQRDSHSFEWNSQEISSSRTHHAPDSVKVGAYTYYKGPLIRYKGGDYYEPGKRNDESWYYGVYRIGPKTTTHTSNGGAGGAGGAGANHAHGANYGAGGAGGSHGSGKGGTGGKGGDYGQAGSRGSTGANGNKNNGKPGSNGGAGGAAIDGNSHVHYSGGGRISGARK